MKNGADVEKVINLPLRERIGRIKYVHEDNVNAEYDSIQLAMDAELKKLVDEGAEE